MGFRKDAYAMCWEVKPVSDVVTNVRLSINRKNRKTGEYEQDFSGYVDFVGSAVSKKALSLTRGSRIRLGDTDVSTTYDKETKKSYMNLKVFSFDEVDSKFNNETDSVQPTETKVNEDKDEVSDVDEAPLPF